MSGCLWMQTQDSCYLCLYVPVCKCVSMCSSVCECECVCACVCVYLQMCICECNHVCVCKYSTFMHKDVTFKHYEHPWTRNSDRVHACLCVWECVFAICRCWQTLSKARLAAGALCSTKQGRKRFWLSLMLFFSILPNSEKAFCFFVAVKATVVSTLSTQCHLWALAVINMHIHTWPDY